MAKKRILRWRKKRNPKVEVQTTHVPLCALGTVIQEKNVFGPLHLRVAIPQKPLFYRPTDKLVFATLGILAGAESVYDINTVLRPHQPLLAAFGYEKCADQSVIQQTMNAATEANVHQLEQALQDIWNQHNRIRLEMPAHIVEQPVTIDLSSLSTAGIKVCPTVEKGICRQPEESICASIGACGHSRDARDCDAVVVSG